MMMKIYNVFVVFALSYLIWKIKNLIKKFCNSLCHARIQKELQPAAHKRALLEPTMCTSGFQPPELHCTS